MIRSVAEQALKSIQDLGFDQSAVRVVTDEFHELQAENGEINLMRTNFETDVALTGILAHKKASLSVNKTDSESLESATANLKDMAQAATADSAHGIAEAQANETFDAGLDKPDYDAMYDRIVELQSYAKQTYPSLNLGSVGVTFENRLSCYLNSNGVQFESRRGLYRVSTAFTSKEGSLASSMMFTGYSSYNLDTAIHESVDVDRLLRESTQQVRTQHIPSKFVGDLVMTPDCVLGFLGFLTMRIGSGPMIAGTSVYKDKLGEEVASPLLNLSSRPVDDQISSGYWVTGDGYKAENSQIIENGVLATYLLGLYGANKTGLERAINAGGCYVVEAGDTKYEDMIASVEQGVLITRFSGGNPNDRGDFSGIAKNSYYIKDGRIQYPIKETTVSGNMVELLHAIKSISKERFNYGGKIVPWICAGGVTVS